MALVECIKKYLLLLTLFGHVLTILAWTKCRLVTKHVLSITDFHLWFFLTFPFIIYLYKNIKLSIKDYLWLTRIYTFMCIIIFLRMNCTEHKIQAIHSNYNLNILMSSNQPSLFQHPKVFDIAVRFQNKAITNTNIDKTDR